MMKPDRRQASSFLNPNPTTKVKRFTHTRVNTVGTDLAEHRVQAPDDKEQRRVVDEHDKPVKSGLVGVVALKMGVFALTTPPPPHTSSFHCFL